MARTKKSQSQHDAEVTRQAKELEKQGWEVEADVPGFPQPKTTGGVRPDVDARKGGQRKIIEVETPDSVDTARDKKQQKQFQKAADRSKKTTFIRKTTDS